AVQRRRRGRPGRERRDLQHLRRPAARPGRLNAAIHAGEGRGMTRQGLRTARAGLLAAAACAAPASAQEPAPAPSDAAPMIAASDWRVVAPDNLLVIDTTQGRI